MHHIYRRNWYNNQNSMLQLLVNTDLHKQQQAKYYAKSILRVKNKILLFASETHLHIYVSHIKEKSVWNENKVQSAQYIENRLCYPSTTEDWKYTNFLKQASAITCAGMILSRFSFIHLSVRPSIRSSVHPSKYFVFLVLFAIFKGSHYHDTMTMVIKCRVDFSLSVNLSE